MFTEAYNIVTCYISIFHFQKHAHMKKKTILPPSDTQDDKNLEKFVSCLLVLHKHTSRHHIHIWWVLLIRFFRLQTKRNTHWVSRLRHRINIIINIIFLLVSFILNYMSLKSLLCLIKQNINHGFHYFYRWRASDDVIKRRIDWLLYVLQVFIWEKHNFIRILMKKKKKKKVLITWNAHNDKNKLSNSSWVEEDRCERILSLTFLTKWKIKTRIFEELFLISEINRI